MGVHADKEVYDKVKDLLGIPRDEPIFITRSQDRIGPANVNSYAVKASGIGCSMEFIAGVYETRDAMINWQGANPDKVKVPD